MPEDKMDIFDALQLSLRLIGLAKIGILPSAKLAKNALDQIQNLKVGELPEFPNTVARLAEICGLIPILPSHDSCRASCDEIRNAIDPKRNPNPKYYRIKSTFNIPISSHSLDLSEAPDNLQETLTVPEYRH